MIDRWCVFHGSIWPDGSAACTYAVEEYESGCDITLTDCREADDAER